MNDQPESSEPTTMRKVPRQARSQQRVTQILDAAAQVFADQGYEAATTNAIATRAGVSIGSLYQFFPHKEALMDALVERYAAGMRDVLTIDPTLPFETTIDRLIDSLAAFDAAHVGFKPLFMLSDAAVGMHPQIVGLVESGVRAYFPQLAPETWHRMAQVMVGIVKGVLPLPGNTAITGDLPPEALLSDLKLALKAYVQAVVQAGD